MDDKAAILTEVCAALSANDPYDAAAILQQRYPFVPIEKIERRYSIPQMIATFARDGFICRYSGMRLVCGAALRLISKRIPDQFPFHRNGRFNACHMAYWDLLPTIDHIHPVSRGGADEGHNWATTSMVRNAAKANFTLDELGWELCPPGDINAWDGLLGWFVNQATSDQTIREDPYMRQWLVAARHLIRPATRVSAPVA
jgi:hypothetical protein